MIIASINQKGGVGKSTVALHLVIWLRERGIDVALVDADVQSSSSIWAREVDENIPIHRYQTANDLLDRVKLLSETVVVIDGPGGLDEATRAILLLCDLALIPCGPSVLDLRAAHEAVHVLRQVQGIRKGPPQGIFIPNKIQKNYRLSNQLLETANELHLSVAPGLGLRQAFADAAGQKSVVWNMGPEAAKAASEMINLFESLFRIYEDAKEDAETKTAIHE